MFKSKYRENSLRLQGWDYSSSGYYYVTICIQKHQELFGTIEKEEKVLNDVGREAKMLWDNISKHFPQVQLDEYVIMPNHIHGIIVINNNVEAPFMASEKKRGAINRASTIKNSPMVNKGSLGAIVRAFKARMKRWTNKNGFSEFKWQSGYYERVIRTEESLKNIRTYIRNNVLKWELDEYNKRK